MNTIKMLLLGCFALVALAPVSASADDAAEAARYQPGSETCVRMERYEDLAKKMEEKLPKYLQADVDKCKFYAKKATSQKQSQQQPAKASFLMTSR